MRAKSWAFALHMYIERTQDESGNNKERDCERKLEKERVVKIKLK